jgi:hypothetical protein
MSDYRISLSDDQDALVDFVLVNILQTPTNQKLDRQGFLQGELLRLLTDWQGRAASFTDTDRLHKFAAADQNTKDQIDKILGVVKR